VTLISSRYRDDGKSFHIGSFSVNISNASRLTRPTIQLSAKEAAPLDDSRKSNEPYRFKKINSASHDARYEERTNRGNIIIFY